MRSYCSGEMDVFVGKVIMFKNSSHINLPSVPCNILPIVKCDIFTALLLKVPVFLDITLCQLVSSSWHFEGTVVLQNVGSCSPSDTTS